MRLIFELICQCLLPKWRQNIEQNQEDSGHFYYRTLSPKYIEKKSRVKNFWILAGALVLLQPTLHVMVIAGLFTTFLSFMVLDEC